MSGLKTFVTNRLTWLSVSYVGLFWFLALLVGVQTTAEFTRLAATTAGLMGMVVYADAAIRAYKAHRWPNPELIAAVGAFLIMTGLGIGGLFQLLWRLSGFPNYILTNHLYSFLVSLIAVGIFILVAVPNTVGRGVPSWTRVRIVLAWSIAIVSMVVMAVVSPNLKWLAEALRPWLLWLPTPS